MQTVLDLLNGCKKENRERERTIGFGRVYISYLALFNITPEYPLISEGFGIGPGTFSF